MKNLTYSCLLASFFFCSQLIAQDRTNYNKMVIGIDGNMLIEEEDDYYIIVDTINNTQLVEESLSHSLIAQANFYIGKELNKQWFVGIISNVCFRSRKRIIPTIRYSKQKQLIVGIGGLGRFTINPTNSFKFYLESSILYTQGKFASNTPLSEEKLYSKGFTINGAGGVLYELSNNIRLKASVGRLTYANQKNRNDVINRSLELDLSLSSFNLGAELGF